MGGGAGTSLPPFTTTPASVKCQQQAGEGGWGCGETGKLLTHEMLGRGRRRPRLPDSYFGSALAGERPLSGSFELVFCQVQGGTEGGGCALLPSTSPQAQVTH